MDKSCRPFIYCQIMERPCDECGSAPIKTCTDCLNTRLCDSIVCNQKHNAITCSLGKTNCSTVEGSDKCAGKHYKQMCEISIKQTRDKVMEMLGLHSGDKLPKYNDRTYLFFGGPIPDPIPHSMRVLRQDPNGHHFLKLLGEPPQCVNWYYVVDWEDFLRVFIRRLNPVQRKELLFKTGGVYHGS